MYKHFFLSCLCHKYWQWTHILAIAVGAYHDVMQTGNNQSILITGESGADRTKNTKKVISYCATICSSDQPGDGNLEKC